MANDAKDYGVTSLADYPKYTWHGGGGDGGASMIEVRVAKLEADVEHIKTDVSELKLTMLKVEGTVGSIDKNLAVLIEKFTGLQESVDKKPSSDAMDKKISDAKLSITLGGTAIIGIGTAAYKLAMHFFFAG